jgi:hypothetical protein
LLRQLPPQVVYSPPHDLCPWPNCDYRLRGIRFNVDKQGDHSVAARLLEAWWGGIGLIGACPSCCQAVLFGLSAKRAVKDIPAGAALLPDDWVSKADLVAEKTG